jgi:hypothetical protein
MMSLLLMTNANVSDGDDDDAYDSAGEGDVSSENDA